ncbi:MAG: hypothetical protein LBQ30_04025 [Treponema sp.]|nr:hypothetical protein [Treponema sp.]
MKKLIVVMIFCLSIGRLFGEAQNANEIPSILLEINTGYSGGIDLPNSIPIEFKLVYPFKRFGFTLETGVLLSEDTNGFHIFMGPTIFFINNSKFRMPLSLGIDLLINHKSNFYAGIGGILSFNYVVSKNLYIGVNFELNYDLNNPYEEIVGYKDAAIGVDENGNKIYPMDNQGDPIKLYPIMENKDHIGNNIYIKPTICLGIQF